MPYSEGTRQRARRRLAVGLLAVLGAAPGPALADPPATTPGATGGLSASASPSTGGQAASGTHAQLRPQVLDRPLESPAPPVEEAPTPEGGPYFVTPIDAPLGFTGPSGVFPSETGQDNNFLPREDRWRIGFPDWDRYDKGFPPLDDYPYIRGHWWDPYNLNVLKGDYPILGQHIFFNLSADLLMLFEARQTPIATTPFESTARPREEPFFGRPDQFLTSNYLSVGLDLFHGDAAFRQPDWRVKLTPVFNFNNFDLQELAVVNPDVTRGTTRGRTFFALNEWFVETKLADTSPDFDFVSVRAGAQPFTSDFRGFIFSDINRAVRLFGTSFSNRDQFNLIYFSQLEKDTNSFLNSFHARHQDILIANYYRQDFLFPGYTAQWSVHYDHDSPTFKFDNNSFLVRPDPVGVFTPHQVDVVYLGWTGDGHINRFNVSNAYYFAVGYDSLNPLANRAQEIRAHMAALELSYDRDWMRFRTSFFYASGDHNINNRYATGFDSIFDNPNFAGGEFSYWQRQQIRLLGVNLVNRESLLPDLRSSKIQGQANFVNPGLFLGNVGVDFEVTPRFRVVTNANLLWFDSVDPLRQLVFQQHINHFIGTDVSMGVEYRPLLSNNIIVKAGVATLIPGLGFRDLYNNVQGEVGPLFAGFVQLNLAF
jgi:hypothetical protein